MPLQAKKMIEEIGSVNGNSNSDSKGPVKRKRGRPPKSSSQPNSPADDLRDLKQKRARKLLKEALKQVMYSSYRFVNAIFRLSFIKLIKHVYLSR